MAGEGLWGSGPVMAVAVEWITGPDGSKKEKMEVVIPPVPATENEFPVVESPEGSGWGTRGSMKGMVLGTMTLSTVLLIDEDGPTVGLT